MFAGRAVCQAVIDHPHAEGLMEDGGRGLLQQFRFLDHFETRPGDLSRHPLPEWDTSSGGQYNVEIIPELTAAAPRGICEREPMTLYQPASGEGDWEPTNHLGRPNCSNLWKAVYPVGHPRVLSLFFYDARGAYDADCAYYGELTSRRLWPADPNFILRAYRYAPPPTLPQAGYCFLELQLLGDSQSGQWSLVLPVAGTEGQARFPRLGWRPTPEEDWQVQQEFRVAPHEVNALRGKPFEQILIWETVDGHFLLNLDGHRQVYYVPPHLRPPEEPLVAPGPVRLIVYGHAALVNLSPLRYPVGEVVDCFIEWAGYFPVDSTIFGTEPSCRVVAWQPPGTAAIASARKTTVGTEDRWVPRVSFTSSTTDRRAVAYLHELDFPPRLSAGLSEPYATQDHHILVSAQGELTADWRSASCRLWLELERTAVADLPAWQGNNLVTVSAGWDTGESLQLATQFTGYLSEAAHLRRGELPERVIVELNARDGFLRLERKYWAHLGSFVGWPLEEAFRRVLQQCGIPEGRLQFSGDPDLIIPCAERRLEPRFAFPEDLPVPQGLDALVRACGYVWGVDQTGTWFCRPPTTYSGTPDFVLDDQTLAAEEVTFVLRAETLDEGGPRDRRFANSVLVAIHRGGEQEVAWRRDVDSQQNPTADDFIGDDWWQVMVGYDEPSAATLAERLLRERHTRQKQLHFRCVGKADLFPDQFVELQASGVKVPAGTVFRLIRKRWTVTSGGDFFTDFVGQLAEPSS